MRISHPIFGKHRTTELSAGEHGAFKEEFKAKNDGKEETPLAIEPRRDLEANWIDAMRGKRAARSSTP